MRLQQLIKRMESYKQLVIKVPYSKLMTTPEGEGKEWIAYAEKMKSVSRSAHPMGDLIQTDERQAVTLTYYRNNVLHVFALPSLISCLITSHKNYSRAEIMQACETLYVFLQAELFLHWDISEFKQQIDLWLKTLIEEGLVMLEDDVYLVNSDNSDALGLLEGLSEHLIQTLQRYFLTLARLKKQGSGVLTSSQLEEQSTLLAQRINLLFGINSPEFFDKALFRTLIKQLISEKVISVSESQELIFDDSINSLLKELENILDPSLQKTILDSF